MNNLQKVAVLCGGTSEERPVSLNTAKSVCTALEELGLTYFKFDPADENWQQQLTEYSPDFVFIALHGGDGEDGVVQAVLDKMGYPYNGSNSLASSRAMDKPVAKQFFQQAGLNVAKEKVYNAENLPANSPLPLPVVVKPSDGGSSFGVTIVKNESEWQTAVEKAANSGDKIMVEEYIPGREFTVTVMNGKSLGVMEIVPELGEFYDYDAKYAEGGSTHLYPAKVNEEIYKKCEDWAEKAHNCLGCSGITRADLRYDENTGTLAILEVNTLPGMTSTSLVPDMAKANGYSFSELIKHIIYSNEFEDIKVAN